MIRKIREWLSVQLAKNPERMVLGAILLINVIFFLLSALVISQLNVAGTEKMGFLEAAFCTITMILDAGCIQFVIEDIGTAGVLTAIICLGIIMIGMVLFTGAVIGYITNYISGFIENSNAGSRKLELSNHVVILNWNTRASEIINDLLYSGKKETIVVLVGSKQEEIKKEIEERLSDTIAKENTYLRKTVQNKPFWQRALIYHREKLKKNVTVLVREGDVYSFKQLSDISLERAKTIVILGNEIYNFDIGERKTNREHGNSLIVKTLMQVADITSADYSDENQKIIVEVADEWTWDLVNKIIKYKQVNGKCNIVPVRIYKILGQLLSQFSLMPELNLAYRELFSNKGASFFSKDLDVEKAAVGTTLAGDRDTIEQNYIRDFFAHNLHAIPLTQMKNDKDSHFFYAAGRQKDIDRVEEVPATDYRVEWNKAYRLQKKTVIILGHNSRCDHIMQGFEAFCGEWGEKDEHGHIRTEKIRQDILEIVVIDEETYLEKMDYYREYPFVVTRPAMSCDRDTICTIIEEVVANNQFDTSVLILSDDYAPAEEIDANALSNLIIVQDIIDEKKKSNPDFDPESIDVIVEIIDPKHYDVVNTYSVNNVVISNRYISKMVTQIGEKEALYEFYRDILTYDAADAENFESKEIYTKKVSRLFTKLPAPCRADELIRAVYNASTDPANEVKNPTLVLGYIKPGGRMVLFSGDQTKIPVELEPNDKLIVFSYH